MRNIFQLENQWKLTYLTVKNIFHWWISENLTDSDVKSTETNSVWRLSFLQIVGEWYDNSFPKSISSFSLSKVYWLCFSYKVCAFSSLSGNNNSIRFFFLLARGSLFVLNFGLLSIINKTVISISSFSVRGLMLTISYKGRKMSFIIQKLQYDQIIPYSWLQIAL